MKKNQNNKILLCFSLITLLISCTENNKTMVLNPDAKLFNKFPNEKNIFFKNLAQYNSGVPRSIFYLDSTLVIFNKTKVSKFIFNNYSLNSNQFSKGYVSKGKGPNESIGASCAGIISNKLWFYDITLNKILLTDKKNAIDKNVFYPFQEHQLGNEYYTKIDFIDSLHFCGVGNLRSLSNSKIEKRYLNSNGIIKNYGEFQETSSNLNIRTIKNIHTSTIHSKPSGNKVVLGYRHSDLIEIYNLETSECIAIKGPEKYDVDFEQKKRSYYYMGKNDKTRKAFINGTVTDNYIYLVYSGHKSENKSEEDRFKWQHGKHVYIYDWEGNPVKKLNLDRHIYTLGVSEDDKILYSYDVNTGYLIKSKIN
jgi:hypothetical protein